MSKWDEIVKRDSLEAFPCVNDFSALKGECCFGSDCYETDCAVLPLYREYMALRAVVEVERGLKTPQAVADQWRRIADKTRPVDGLLAAAFDEKANAWEGIA